MSIITMRKEYKDGEICEIEQYTEYPGSVTFRQTGHHDMNDFEIYTTMQKVMKLIRAGLE